MYGQIDGSDGQKGRVVSVGEEKRRLQCTDGNQTLAKRGQMFGYGQKGGGCSDTMVDGKRS